MRRIGNRLAAATVAGTMIAVILVGSGAVAGAVSRTPQPLQIETSSLTQAGQQLVWRVQLTQPFSPGALARAHRALCLLLEGARSGIVTGKVCLSGPARHSRQPQLLYMKVTGNSSGPARPIDTTVSRISASELTASFLPSAVGESYSPFYWQVVSSLKAAACAPPAPGGGGCFELYPGKPALLMLHSPVPVGCAAKGPSLVYHGPTKGREIALTFDDGPWDAPPTIDFLRVLERASVPATFFEIGRQIAPYDRGGVAEKRMLADGDMIGDHTWSHPDMPRVAPAEQRAQLLETVRAIRHATGGFTPCLWRPPYGDVSPSLVRLARSLGMLTIQWDVDPRDWATPGVTAIYSNVIANSRSGAIVIQHFGGGPRYQTLAALPQEIATLQRRGYHFVTVAQLLGLKLLYR